MTINIDFDKRKTLLENEFIKTWESSSEVEKELGISRTAICNCLNGLSKKSNNYIWKYEE